MTINALAAEMVMDRTTLGRNVRPLQRDGLIRIAPDPADRRSKQVELTRRGEKQFEAAYDAWKQAQRRFDAAFGSSRAGELRAMLRAVTATEFAAGDTAH
jgi:DNA-binding MarR family transcriptional regulator